ncbi:MAG: hypothetical protein R6U56_08985, partial [Opitutales bacterium]
PSRLKIKSVPPIFVPCGQRGTSAKPNEGMAQPERLQKLNRIAIEQMEILTSEHSRRLLGGGDAE